MDTTASRGGVAPDGSTADGTGGAAVPGAGAGRMRVEVEAMPDGRTIRYFAAAPHVRDVRGDSPENHAHGPEARP
jgi:hypothetical protein